MAKSVEFTLHEERKINPNILITSIVLTLVSLMLYLYTFKDTLLIQIVRINSFNFLEKIWNLGISVYIILFGIISLFFQTIIVSRWNGVITNGSMNMKQVLNYLSSSESDDRIVLLIRLMSAKLENIKDRFWTFINYGIFFIFALFLPNISLLLFFISFLFLAIYIGTLQLNIKEMDEIKKTMGAYILENESVLKKTDININPVLFFVFSFITLGVYWVFEMIRITKKINEYVEKDKFFAEKVFVKLGGK